MGKWNLERRCIECKGELTYNEVMYSSGQCLICGYKHPNACTIVGVTEHPYYTKRVGLRFIRVYREDSNGTSSKL